MFELANHDKGAEVFELQHISIPWMITKHERSKGRSIYYVRREGEGGGYPKANVVSEVA